MDEASTNRNFFVSVYDGHSTRFHTELYAKTRAHQIKDGTHRTIPLEYTGNFDEHSHEYVWINTYENTIFRGLFTSINPSYFDVNKKGVLLILTHCRSFR